MKIEIDPRMDRKAYYIIMVVTAIFIVTSALSVISKEWYFALFGTILYTIISGMYFLGYMYVFKRINVSLAVLFYVGLLGVLGYVL